MTPPPTQSDKSHSRAKQNAEGRYIIDPVHRQNTNLGTYVEGQSLVRPYRPRGPMALPAREPLRTANAWQNRIPTIVDEFEHERFKDVPDFTLGDFVKNIAQKEKVPLVKVEKVCRCEDVIKILSINDEAIILQDQIHFKYIIKIAIFVFRLCTQKRTTRNCRKFLPNCSFSQKLKNVWQR